LPSYLLNPIVERFHELGIFRDTVHGEPNHVLINEYRRGEGIMPHEDGSAYAHVVATVSLGAPTCLEIIAKKPATGSDDVQPPNNDDHIVQEVDSAGCQIENEKDIFKQTTDSNYKISARILQEPRSLLITTGSAYTDLLHGIAAVEVDEDLNEETVANWNLLADVPAIEQNGGRNERGTRVSLTYRDVLKVSKAAGKVFGVGRR
jgi:alkylated DNA repair protein alkB family protein 6